MAGLESVQVVKKDGKIYLHARDSVGVGVEVHLPKKQAISLARVLVAGAK